MSDTYGFNNTIFTSTDNTGSNVTLFAPTVIDISAQDISLRMANITASADYLLDCCLTLDVSWARAALRWTDSDSADESYDFCLNSEASFNEAIRDVMAGAMQEGGVARDGGVTKYLHTMGNSGEETFPEHVLAWATHESTGLGSLRHMVLNAVDFKEDVSATVIGNQFENNLQTDASDGQVLLEMMNAWDVCQNTTGNSRFAALSELDDVDISYTDSPIPFAEDDYLIFKVRVHGSSTTDRAHGIAANVAPTVAQNSDSAPNGLNVANGADSGISSGTIADPGTAEWFIRVQLKNAGNATEKLSAYKLPTDTSSSPL